MTPSPLTRRVGARVKDRRLALEMTQREVAASCKLDLTTIQQIETGRRCTLDNLAAVTGALGIELARLFS